MRVKIPSNTVDAIKKLTVILGGCVVSYVFVCVGTVFYCQIFVDETLCGTHSFTKLLPNFFFEN